MELTYFPRFTQTPQMHWSINVAWHTFIVHNYILADFIDLVKLLFLEKGLAHFKRLLENNLGLDERNQKNLTSSASYLSYKNVMVIHCLKEEYV